MKPIYHLIVYLLLSSSALGQLVSFELLKNKTYYKEGDNVQVTIMHIDSAQQKRIKISSDLAPQVINLKSGTDTLINLGKIESKGVYNFRFEFGQDTVRYFQIAVLEGINEKNYFERIPFTIPASLSSVQNSFTSLCYAINDTVTHPDSLWPQQEVNKANSCLIAYKGYKASDSTSVIISGRYCHHKNNQSPLTYIDTMLADSTLKLLTQEQLLNLYLRLLLSGGAFTTGQELKFPEKLQSSSMRQFPSVVLQTICDYNVQQPSASLLLLTDVQKKKLQPEKKP